MKKIVLSLFILLSCIGVLNAEYKFTEHPNLLNKGTTQSFSLITIRSTKYDGMVTQRLFVDEMIYHSINDWLNVGFSVSYGWVDINKKIMGQKVLIQTKGMKDPSIELQCYLFGIGGLDISFHQKVFFPLGNEIYSYNTFASNSILVMEHAFKYFNIFSNIIYAKEGNEKDKYQYFAYVVGISKYITDGWSLGVDLYIPDESRLGQEIHNPDRYVTLTNLFVIGKHKISLKYIVNIDAPKKDRSFCKLGYIYDF